MIQLQRNRLIGKRPLEAKKQGQTKAKTADDTVHMSSDNNFKCVSMSVLGLIQNEFVL